MGVRISIQCVFFLEHTYPRPFLPARLALTDPRVPLFEFPLDVIRLSGGSILPFGILFIFHFFSLFLLYYGDAAVMTVLNTCHDTSLL
jgi:hypothetical protein